MAIVEPFSRVVQSAGLPALGIDAVGADTYATVLTSPSRECYYMHVSTGDNGAIISLDGGTTDHFAIPANVERFFPGLAVPASAVIQGKNLVPGSNYTNLRISIW